MLYHIRVPVKLKGVFRVWTLDKLEDVIRKKFEKGAYVQTCMQLDTENMRQIPVCEDCESEIHDNKELAAGLCHECITLEQRRSRDELMHPDEGR